MIVSYNDSEILMELIHKDRSRQVFSAKLVSGEWPATDLELIDIANGSQGHLGGEVNRTLEVTKRMVYVYTD